MHFLSQFENSATFHTRLMTSASFKIVLMHQFNIFTPLNVSMQLQLVLIHHILKNYSTHANTIKTNATIKK